MSADKDWPCPNDSIDSDTAVRVNIMLSGLRVFLLVATEDIEFRRLDLTSFCGSIFSTAEFSGTADIDEVELTVVVESPSLVLISSRLLGEEDLDTAGDHERREKDVGVSERA